MWAAMAREREVHKVLTRERILGLDLVKGVKAGTAPGATFPASTDTERPASAGPETPTTEEEDGSPEEEQVTGLPLFGDEADADA